MTALLSFRDIWVEFGDRIILEKINLDIAEKSIVSIVGPSGAGKSSLLRLVLGQQAPSRGRILLDGAPLASECAKAPLTARLFGSARRAAREEAVAMLEAVGLGHSLDQYPAELSGGMQQRLAFAQALIKRPRILLLDEPFGALDPGIRADMHALVRHLWREHGLTIMMVTHDLREAFSLGTRVLAIDKVRHDPHAPHRFGAKVVYDLPLRQRDESEGLEGAEDAAPEKEPVPDQAHPQAVAH